VRAAVLLAVWVALLLLAGAGASRLVLGRFPEVFFGTCEWRSSRRGRILRAVLAAAMVVAGAAALAGTAVLVLARGSVE